MRFTITSFIILFYTCSLSYLLTSLHLSSLLQVNNDTEEKYGCLDMHMLWSGRDGPLLLTDDQLHPSGFRVPVTNLTSSVRDVFAVKGCAFPPVENLGVLQQVHRGESVSTQSWEDEVQKTAHPSLQIRSSELLNELLQDRTANVGQDHQQTKLQQKLIKLLIKSNNNPPLCFKVKVNRTTHDWRQPALYLPEKTWKNWKDW